MPTPLLPPVSYYTRIGSRTGGSWREMMMAAPSFTSPLTGGARRAAAADRLG